MFWKYGFVGGSGGGGAPEASENILKKLVEKSMETCKLLKIAVNF